MSSPAGWRTESLTVYVTGMGRRNAARVAAEVLQTASPAWVVTAGFAGGLDPALKLGTVGFMADDGFPLRDRLDHTGARELIFHEATRVAATPEAKAVLRRETGTEAVEMESATIRALCRERRIHSATVRVISDTANEGLPLDFGVLMNADDKLDFGRLAGTLLRSPGKIPELIRFQRRVSEAADQLARVLVAISRPE